MNIRLRPINPVTGIKLHMLHRYHTSRRWPIPELLRLPRTAGPDSSDPSAVRHLVRPRSKAASVTPVFVKSSCDLLLFNQELPHFIDSASPVSSCHICVQLAFRVAASISVPRMYQHVNLCRPPALVVCTAHPTGDWTVQQARKLALTLGERFEGIRFLIHGRGSNFTASFDAVFQAAGTRVVHSAVQAPRMNAIMERWVGSCRRELLDRTLIWDQRHLMTVLREYEDFYNRHRPHRNPEPGPAAAPAAR